MMHGTLERHKSRLIPDVDIGGDGRLVVADPEGTFPTRSTPSKERSSLPEYDVNSFRSYDPKPRKKIPSSGQNRHTEEVRRLSLTSKPESANASLQKKIRRLRGEESPARAYSWQYDSNQPARLFGTVDRGTWSSHGNNRRKIDKKHRLSVDYPSSPIRQNSFLSSKRSLKRLDVSGVKNDKKKKTSRTNSILEIYKADLNPYANPVGLARGDSKSGINKRLIEDELPSLIFLVTGGSILAAGIAHALISKWHIFYCLIWAGVLVMMLGVAGRFHKTDYLTKWLNGTYICLGIISSIAVMASIAFILQVSIPMVIRLSTNVAPSGVIQEVLYTSSNNTIISSLSSAQIVWGSLAIEVAAFVFCLIQFFGLTSTLVAISNHWDAVYHATSECNYRGQPRFFNPFEQSSIAQVTGLFGIFVFALWPDLNPGPKHHCSTLWAPAVVFLASLISICYGKREDNIKLGVLSFIIQIMALSAVTASAILVILGLVDNIDFLSNGALESVQEKGVIASSVFNGFYVGCALVNAIFIIGYLMRGLKKICCCDCLSLDDS